MLLNSIGSNSKNIRGAINRKFAVALALYSGSQKLLSKRSGVSVNTIYLIKHNRTNPTSAVIMRLSNELNMSPTEAGLI